MRSFFSHWLQKGALMNPFAQVVHSFSFKHDPQLGLQTTVDTQSAHCTHLFSLSTNPSEQAPQTKVLASKSFLHTVHPGIVEQSTLL